ncbi:glutamate synthase [Striga asiatica]|uniref:Glutamate synthase n=1 Tax=Striga asiatica TaxID=4170 RepID=A0A5A7RJH4_STRAF|nr:glutamate synthase [Striga asiatica]
MGRRSDSDEEGVAGREAPVGVGPGEARVVDGGEPRPADGAEADQGPRRQPEEYFAVDVRRESPFKSVFCTNIVVIELILVLSRIKFWVKQGINIFTSYH